MLKALLSTDQKLEQFIYLHRPTGADNFLAWITTNATIISFSLLGMLLFIYFIKKDKNYLYTVINAALLIGLTAIVTGTTKHFVARLRPYEVDQLIATPFIDSGGFSFPSGHTTEVFTLFFAIFFFLNNRYWHFIFLLWALLIAYTRMAFGVHYPLDIIGGICVSLIVVWLWQKYEPVGKYFFKING